MALRQAALAGLDRLVADEHALVGCLLGHLENERGDARALVEQLTARLVALTAAEARVLGQVCDELGLGGLDHAPLLGAVAELQGTQPGTSPFRSSLGVLARSCRAHVERWFTHHVMAEGYLRMFRHYIAEGVLPGGRRVGIVS